MSSMILATVPDRRIIEASPDLASALGSAPRFLVGSDCARIVCCRNAMGEPLCQQLCPAVIATSSKCGIAQDVELWLERPSGELRSFRATFQRIRSLYNGMVVAFFRETAVSEVAVVCQESEKVELTEALPDALTRIEGRRLRPLGD